MLSSSTVALSTPSRHAKTPMNADPGPNTTPATMNQPIITANCVILLAVHNDAKSEDNDAKIASHWMKSSTTASVVEEASGAVSEGTNKYLNLA